jgi:hypothetical protein
MLLRLAAFLPEQRQKSKLLLMAFALLHLSINIGTGPQEIPRLHQINHSKSLPTNFHKGQHGRIKSIIFSSDELGKADQPELARILSKYILTEIDATTNKQFTACPIWGQL